MKSNIYWNGSFFERGKATLIIGGSAGSEGKGCFVGYLAANYRSHFNKVACQFMSNAGHTAFGKVVKQVPMTAAVLGNLGNHKRYLIGPGSAITMDVLLAEITEFGLDPTCLGIHPRAIIILQRHRNIEAEITKRVASTMKGCGAAWADRALRHPDTVLAQDVKDLESYICDTTKELADSMKSNCSVVVEGSQGFDLDLYHGLQYPYCTSRAVSAAAVLADVGIAPKFCGPVFAVCRTFPIRVGNVVEDGEQKGYSGDYANDNRETSFEEVQVGAGYSAEEVKKEYTTVTKRMRRIFTFSKERYAAMIMVNQPTGVMMSFLDYMDKRNAQASTAGGLTLETLTWLNELESEFKVPIVAVSVGPDRVIVRPKEGW